MQPDLDKIIHQRCNTWALDHSHRLSMAHDQFLAIRQIGLTQIAEGLSHAINTVKPQDGEKTAPAFTRKWLETFATGNIVQSLGQAYEIYKGRRCPRIPNGDFLLISRIMQIHGVKGEFDNPAHITAEFDIPTNAWFFDSVTNGELPLSILLEIALQPCGVLSAWLGTPLRFPAVNYFFRNLDGDNQILKIVDLREKTLTTQAELTKTTFNGSIIIQHFDFELVCNGETVLKGTSSFGYFPEETMATQIGLDGGRPSHPWGKNPANTPGALLALSGSVPFYPDHPTAKLGLIDEVSISLDDGTCSKGYVMASRRNSPDDWFYANHFYQDPVMPGSLGIEAIIQAFKALIYSMERSDNPVSLAEGAAFQWKYRGQVLPSHQKMWVEVHLQNQEMFNSKNTFTAEASLWADDIRIYDIKNLALQQTKGNQR